MKLYHVSEDPDIRVFEPRVPTRSDMAGGEGLVWAVNETGLPNYLVPRNCPRVTWHAGPDTTLDDMQLYLSSPTCRHVVAIEAKWFSVMQKTTLYLYEFYPDDFSLQDRVAGYYTSRVWQKPCTMHVIDNLFEELWKRNVELRVVDNLWALRDIISETSFDWSMIRMQMAQKPR